MADWMAYRLCGEMATDYSLASRTMLFDLAARDWPAELFEAADLDRPLMAPTVRAGTTLGRVQPDAATMTGLPPERTFVMIGLHDGGAASTHRGSDSVSTGTPYMSNAARPGSPSERSSSSWHETPTSASRAWWMPLGHLPSGTW
ncbi:FGGY family carbohydrate kinase [Candidatus Poriferisodalis sp.]|uniref:FGGY family carbohydrate kinase n=1 Tax=Candidatus Poriferisodalis sp. TaxID=3101277 RepID=UPI003B020888